MKTRFLLITAIITLLFCNCRDTQMGQQSYPPKKTIKNTAQNIRAAIQHDTICIAAVGDIMLGTSYPDSKTLPSDSAKNSFKNIKDELQGADICFGNLEGTLLDEGLPANYRLHQLQSPYLFRMPQAYGKVIKDVGFNVLSLANNHIGDFSDTGRINTMEILDSLAIQYGGQVKHPSSVFKINGITYGFCAFAPNGYTLSIFDQKNEYRIIHDLKQRCDIVLVSFHGGGEGKAFEHVPFNNEVFINEKRGDVHAFAHTAIDAGADLVFGNGPHVCRAMELYKNRLIAYSLGNFCTYKSVSVAGICGYAPLLRAYINKNGEFLYGRIISNLQTHNWGLEPDSLNQAAMRIKALTETDFPQSGLSIANDGLVVRTPANLP